MRAVTKIKPLCSWCDPEELFNDLCIQSQDGEGRWNNIWLHPSHRNPDFSLVINSPRRHGAWLEQRHKRKRSILWGVEHSQSVWRRDYNYARWERKSDWAKVVTHQSQLNWCEFHIRRSYRYLREHHPEKTRVLSAVIASGDALPGQRKRVAFLKYLETQDLTFLVTPFDHYGYDNRHNFQHYRGPLPRRTKESGLEPYKYSLAFEAIDEPNYVTEKLFDCLLCECLPFYWGAPNLEEWLDPECFIRLDLGDPHAAFQTIRRAILERQWEQRLPAIRRAKEMILDQYNIFPALENIMQGVRPRPAAG